MTIIKYVMMVSLLTQVFLLYAQTNYKEGTLVKNDGTLLKGFINYREWHKNPDRIQFKQDIGSIDAQTFTVDSITSFSIAGYDSYTKYILPVSMDEIDFEKLKETIDTTSVTKAVFIKEITKGDRIDLFSYTDDIKVRYFILDKRQTLPYELTYRKILKNGQEITHPLYRQQLSGIAHHYGVLTANLDSRISKAAYSGKDIKNIVSKINTKNDEIAASTNTTRKKSDFFAGAGIAMSTMTYKGKTLLLVDGLDNSGSFKYKDKVTTHSYLPVISAGADFYINPDIKKLIIRAELSATNIKSTVKSYYRFNIFSDEELNTYNYSAWNIGFSPQFILNMYNTKRLKWYAGTGFLLNYTANNKNSLERRYSQNGELININNEYLQLKKFSMNLLVRSGVRINEQFDISLYWINPSELTNYKVARQSIKANTLSFTVLYFRKK